MSDFNFKEYLSDDEMKRIAEDAFRSAVFSKTKENWERIISNSAYDCAARIVDEVLGAEMDKLIAEKVVKIIDELSAFLVFRKADAWDRKESHAYNIVQQAVIDNKELVNEKVKLAIHQISKKDALEIIKSKNIHLS